MADKKISELSALTGASVATDDQLVIVDTSAGSTKSITMDEFKNALDTATGFVRITGDTMTGALDVQSTITADGLTVSGDAVFSPDNDGVRITGTNYATLRLEENDTTDLNTSMFNSVGDFVITTSSDDRSTTTDRIRLDHSTGDVRFYGNVEVAMDADSAVRLSVSGAVGTTNGSESSPTHTFYGDPDTGMYRAAANTLGFSTGGTELLRISSTAVVINEGGADLDFRVESDNSTDAIRVDASSDDVIFGSSATGNSNAYFGNVHSADTFFM